MSINCQSLNVKFSKIKLLIDTFAEYGKPIQVLCIKKTGFENTNLIDMGQFHIDNYHLLTKNRYACDHGGLACYIHKNWNYTIQLTLVESPYWEKMFVEISNPDNPKSTFTVGNFYRPPHIAVAQITSFIDYFAEKLAHFNTREKFYICGDFNINLLSLSSNEHVRNYFEGILSSGFLPTITLPTRLSVNSTLIDNILLNKQEHLNFAGILDYEISDHQMTLINANLMPPTEKNKNVTIYSHNDESISKFRNDIIDKRIFNRLNKDLHSNPNANYNLLESEIVHSMNPPLGIKIVKFNKKKHKRDPWITYGILKSVNQKNLLFKRMKKTNVESPLYDDRK